MHQLPRRPPLQGAGRFFEKRQSSVSFMRGYDGERFLVQSHDVDKIAIVHEKGHRVRFHIALNGESRRIVSRAFEVIENKATKNHWSRVYDNAAYMFAMNFAIKRKMID